MVRYPARASAAVLGEQLSPLVDARTGPLREEVAVQLAPEKELVRLCAEAEREAAPSATDPRERILAFYDEYRPRLYRYMRSMQLRRESADEVIQETFMRLTGILLRGTEIENIGGWIVRVAHNLAIDVLKKERLGVMSSEGAAFAIENRVDTAMMSPEEAYASKEQNTKMEEALRSLKPQHRQCFQMRAQGLRYKEIGVALGISEQRAAFVVKQVAVRLAAICG
jgi:RNA polymerase sigma-70 factor, ECF subfamily